MARHPCRFGQGFMILRIAIVQSSSITTSASTPAPSIQASPSPPSRRHAGLFYHQTNVPFVIMTTPSFTHFPLQSTTNIRLIHLSPSPTFSAPLHVNIIQVPLSNRPPYEALSYSWDTHLGLTSIFCNASLPLQITLNCASALRHLRLPTQIRILWVDAICIDQTSVSDKNIQIPLMRDIYRQAEVVLVWIGEGGKVEEEEFNGFRYLARDTSRDPDRLPGEDKCIDGCLWATCGCLKVVLGGAAKMSMLCFFSLLRRHHGVYTLLARTVISTLTT